MLRYVCRIRTLSMYAVLLFLGVPLMAEEPAPAPALDLNAPMPVDPNVKMGKLPNGLTYWIRSNKTPPGKVGIWMHVGSGSINEEDAQRGLAHFLEHMAFNGSENFPPGTLVKYFESIGLRFGQHQNAFTSFDQTTYQITLPNVEEATVAKGLQCLADFGYRMTLPEEEINRERNVILEEARARKGAGQRIMEKLLPVLLPGSRVADRLPIGKEEIIKTVPKKEFEAYYKKWYNPTRTTVILVGDLPIETAEKLIADAYGAWKAPETQAVSLEPGVKPYTESRAAVVTDPEIPFASVNLAAMHPLKKVLTVGEFRADLVESLGTAIINRRFQEQVAKGTAPYQGANAGVSNFLNVITYVSSQAMGQPDKWKPMLESLIAELKRGSELGFLDQELETVKKSMLSGVEQSAKTETTRDSSSFLSSMNGVLSEGQKPVSAAQHLELVQKLLPTITLAEVNKTFKENFAPGNRAFYVLMPDRKDLKVPTEAEVLAVAKAADASKIEAKVAEARIEKLLEADPAPGVIKDRNEDEDLKVTTVKFENGVLAHFRNMDFKKNQVTVRITLAAGAITETPATKGVNDVAELGWSRPATDKITSTQIREYMTGRKVGVGGSIGLDWSSVSVAGSPEDLEEGLRLAHLMLTQPKIEEPAFKHFIETTEQELEERKSDVGAQLGDKLSEFQFGGDSRHRVITLDQLHALKLADGQARLEEIIRSAPIEVAVVGDMPVEKMIELVSKYVGSLSKREKIDEDTLSEFRKLNLPDGPRVERVEVETITPTAEVLAGWRGADWKKVKERRVLGLISNIITARLHEEVRQKQGLAYSPYSFNSAGQNHPGTGLFVAQFKTDPDKADAAGSVLREIVTNFAASGPTDAEVETVHKQMQNIMETQMKEPSYWVGILADMKYRGTKLSDVKEVIEKLTTYTKEDIAEVAKKYLKPEHFVLVVAVPKKKPGAETPKPEEKKDAPKTEEKKVDAPEVKKDAPKAEEKKEESKAPAPEVKKDAPAPTK